MPHERQSLPIDSDRLLKDAAVSAERTKGADVQRIVLTNLALVGNAIQLAIGIHAAVFLHILELTAVSYLVIGIIQLIKVRSVVFRHTESADILILFTQIFVVSVFETGIDRVVENDILKGFRSITAAGRKAQAQNQRQQKRKILFQKILHSHHSFFLTVQLIIGAVIALEDNTFIQCKHPISGAVRFLYLRHCPNHLLLTFCPIVIIEVAGGVNIQSAAFHFHTAAVQSAFLVTVDIDAAIPQ